MTIRDLSPRALDASAQIDRLAGALASASGHDGEDELDTLIADALRAVTQLVDADYAMLENEGTDGARGWRHVWSRPGAIVGREPRVSVPVTQKARASCEFSVGVRESGADMPPAILDALRGLAHVMVLLLDREPASRRSTLAGQAPHVSMAPVWQAGEDRKSTRLNSSHSQISYAVFCLKKKKKK